MKFPDSLFKIFSEIYRRKRIFEFEIELNFLSHFLVLFLEGKKIFENILI